MGHALKRPNFEPSVWCPNCRKPIAVLADTCGHCGVYLTKGFRKKGKSKANLAAAALLSCIIPGAGQIYKGSRAAGLIWLVLVGAGYIVSIIYGLMLHFLCVFAAATGKH